MKCCSVCGLSKAAQDFQKRSASHDGLTAACKACLKERDKARESPERAAKRAEYIRTEAGKAAKKRATDAYNDRYPMRRAAHVIVGNAVRDRKLVKPHAYESCGLTEALEAHHDDYTKPLDVRWLCDPCHKEWHRNNEPIYQ